jgi:hypothetical protein
MARKTNSVILALAIAQERQVWDRFVAMCLRLVREADYLKQAHKHIVQIGGEPIDPLLYEPVVGVVEDLLARNGLNT